MPDTPAAPAAPATPAGPGSPPPSTPASPTAPGEPVVAPSAPVSPEQPPVAEQPPADPDEQYIRWLEEHDPDEVLQKAPKFKRRYEGRIGSEADRLAQKRQAEDEARRQRQELRQQLDDSPLDAVETIRKQLDEEDRIAADAQQRLGAWAELDVHLNALFAALPPEAQAPLRGKPYYGPPAQARAEYLKDLMEALSEHKSTARVKEVQKEFDRKMADAVAKARREAREAGALDVLGDANAQDSPDTGGGTAAPGALTDTEFQAHKHDREWIRAQEKNGRMGPYLATKRRR